MIVAQQFLPEVSSNNHSFLSGGGEEEQQSFFGGQQNQGGSQQSAGRVVGTGGSPQQGNFSLEPLYQGLQQGASSPNFAKLASGGGQGLGSVIKMLSAFAGAGLPTPFNILGGGALGAVGGALEGRAQQGSIDRVLSEDKQRQNELIREIISRFTKGTGEGSLSSLSGRLNQLGLGDSSLSRDVISDATSKVGESARLHAMQTGLSPLERGDLLARREAQSPLSRSIAGGLSGVSGAVSGREFNVGG